MTTPQRARRAEGGFTLIELLLAMSILIFITTIMWSTFSQTLTTKRTIEAAQDRAHGVRLALTRMAREIGMAFLSDSENTALEERRTMFIGRAHGAVDELRFSTFAHRRLRAGGAEADTSVVKYYADADPVERGRINLMRRETRRLQAQDADSVTGEAYVLATDVRGLKFVYYDHKKKDWREDWNTMGADGLPYLPTQVRIVLTVTDERGRDVTYTTSVRPQMTERVAYRPVRS